MKNPTHKENSYLEIYYRPLLFLMGLPLIIAAIFLALANPLITHHTYHASIFRLLAALLAIAGGSAIIFAFLPHRSRQWPTSNKPKRVHLSLKPPLKVYFYAILKTMINDKIFLKCDQKSTTKSRRYLIHANY